MKKFKLYLKKTKDFFLKLYTRFANYKNSKKWFVLYLCVLTFFLFVFPVIELKLKAGAVSRVWFFLFWWALWKSTFVILLAIVWLFLWNLSISFKSWITRLCSLREDEPLVDFLLLWIIVSVFMWVMDWVNVPIAGGVTQNVEFLGRWIIDGLLLLWWLIWSFMTLRKSSSKSNRKTRIMNIVEENHKSVEPSHNRSNQVTHLFDDLNHEN